MRKTCLMTTYLNINKVETYSVESVSLYIHVKE